MIAVWPCVWDTCKWYGMSAVAFYVFCVHLRTMGCHLCHEILYSIELHAPMYYFANFTLHIYMSPFSPKGYSVPKAFIAAQSPMTNTKSDFWELVWQFRTPTIVLLTNFKEGKQVRTGFVHCANLLQELVICVSTFGYNVLSNLVRCHHSSTSVCLIK